MQMADLIERAEPDGCARFRERLERYGTPVNVDGEPPKVKRRLEASRLYVARHRAKPARQLQLWLPGTEPGKV